MASVFVLELMADLQPYRFEPDRVPSPEDMRKRKRRSKRSDRRHIFGVLVRDVKLCQRQENVFDVENSQEQKTKWKVKF